MNGSETTIPTPKKAWRVQPSWPFVATLMFGFLCLLVVMCRLAYVQQIVIRQQNEEIQQEKEEHKLLSGFHNENLKEISEVESYEAHDRRQIKAVQKQIEKLPEGAEKKALKEEIGKLLITQPRKRPWSLIPPEWRE